jgi:hypothetical protein
MCKLDLYNPCSMQCWLPEGPKMGLGNPSTKVRKPSNYGEYVSTAGAAVKCTTNL